MASEEQPLLNHDDQHVLALNERLRSLDIVCFHFIIQILMKSS